MEAGTERLWADTGHVEADTGLDEADCRSWDLCSTMCLGISLMWGWGRRSVELVVLVLGWVLATTGSLEPVLLRF